MPNPPGVKKIRKKMIARRAATQAAQAAVARSGYSTTAGAGLGELARKKKATRKSPGS